MYPTSPAATKPTGRSFDKINIIVDAYSQLRISGLTTTPSPRELDMALNRLEDMAAEWQSRNIIVGYNFTEDPDPNDESGLQPAFKQAFAKSLALQLAPDYNLPISRGLERSAKGSLTSLMNAVSLARLQANPYPERMPRGSGNMLRFNRWARFYRVQQQFLNTSQGEQIFIGDIQNYNFHFDSQLNDNEEIQNFDLQLDSGLKLVSSSLDNSKNSILYRIEAVNNNNVRASDFGAQVTAIIDTSEGRRLTQRSFFTLISRSAGNAVSTN